MEVEDLFLLLLLCMAKRDHNFRKLLFFVFCNLNR